MGQSWVLVRFVAAISAIGLFGGACGSEPGASDEHGTVNGYSVVLRDNREGPDAPCIGVEVQASDATTVTVACPTLPTEDEEYAAAIEVDSEAFVVGFGLGENETLIDDGLEVVEAVTISDGTATRELQTA